MAKAEIQRRKELVFEDFLEKHNGRILEEMRLSKMLSLWAAKTVALPTRQ